MDPTDNIPAIDFHKLYKEEKRKARRQQQQEQIQQKQKKLQQEEEGEAASGTAARKNDDDDEPPRSADNGDHGGGSSSSSSNSGGRDDLDHQPQPPTLPPQHGDVVPVYPRWGYAGWARRKLYVPQLDQVRDCLSSARKKKHRHYQPGRILYRSDFLREEEEYQASLWEWLLSLPENVDTTNDELSAVGKWTTLKHAQRRVALFDSRLLPGGKFPPPLQLLVDAVVDAGAWFDDDHNNDDDDNDYYPNHILINEYKLPHQGILPHTDGPAYYPRTATISLGFGSVLFNFTPTPPSSRQAASTNNNDGGDGSSTPPPNYQVLLEGRGSLVVFEKELYSDYRHGIDEMPGRNVEHASEQCWNADVGTAVLRGHRISITIRHKK